ncbi:hypothetical protein AB0J47_41835 [Nocardia sp. NPDC049737]|uniref:hypothetical protein n=1 Tax=Nocardia sp. NPDC049737 TaxID=3154358 RepID=UPI00343FEB6B
MNNDVRAVNVELVARMPWLVAAPESIWSISGTFGDELGSFIDCLAMVLPYDPATSAPVFVLIHPNSHTSLTSPMRYIAADKVFRATQLVLVHADEPREAYWMDEQDVVDRGFIR